MYREDVAAAAQTPAVHVDELYGHDDLSRLDDLDIGDVSTSGTPSMTTTIDQQLWALDPQGNWSSFASDLDFASGISTLDPHQDRTHNDANEITGLAAAPLAPASSNWVDPTYDAAGNMTKRPDPSDQDSATKAHLITYDAWNRVVKITDNDVPTTLATYEYDGLGRRIEKVIGSDTYDYYHNESWQVVEVRKNQDTDADPVEQFVYDTNYIDALVMRWYDENQDGTADEQYYLYDASFSVIALLDSQGTPLERYRYTPYGQRIVMDASFANPGGTSGYGQQRGFQGLLHDEESGLIENRHRMLDPLTGRFLQRDFKLYPDGMNCYAAYHIMSGANDPSGLIKLTVSAAAWCCENPVCCKVAFEIRQNVQKQMRVRYGRVQDNTVHNAVRHCVWMCATSGSWWCSAQQAGELGEAHEDYPTNPPHDKAVDLYNNDVGISLARNGDSVNDCFDKCERAARQHKLYWYDPVAPPAPRFVFGYYSGPTDRMAEHFRTHQEKYYKALINSKTSATGTHLNPAWSLEYLDLVKKIVGEHPTSHVLMTTHGPLVLTNPPGLTHRQVPSTRLGHRSSF